MKKKLPGLNTFRMQGTHLNTLCRLYTFNSQPFSLSFAESRSSGSNCSGSKKEEAAGGAGGGAGGGESKSTGHTGSGSESELRKENAPSDRSVAVPPNEHSMHSLISLAHSVHSTHSHSGSLVYGPPGLPAQPPPSLPITAPPGSPPGRDLASVPPELTASRQSFRMAMGNPSEFFVDVM